MTTELQPDQMQLASMIATGDAAPLRDFTGRPDAGLTTWSHPNDPETLLEYHPEIMEIRPAFPSEAARLPYPPPPGVATWVSSLCAYAVLDDRCERVIGSMFLADTGRDEAAQ